ncbi:MAG: response regulator transcription factor [Anaerolineae bacterium]|nr:response regulator transcription factor [Anaerolineae bacterium]
MGRETVLLIGRTDTKDENYVDTLKKRYQLLVTSSGKQALELVKTHQPGVIVLDAASMRTPGDRICRQLREYFPTLPIVHIHNSPDNEINSPADVFFTPPVTSRKLTNCLTRLLKSKGDEIIHCGPFAMNVPRRVLMVHGHEKQLTPKLALLIELFLRHPNQVIPRKQLMETIWQTDYLGDTRTLDVHIRWVRQVLENAGEYPRCLNTVRGIGYRLDVQ